MDKLYGENKEKRFMFLLEQTLFDDYKQYCKGHGISIGKQIRLHMLDDLNKLYHGEKKNN